MKQIVPNLFVFDELGESVHAYLWVWDQGVTLIDTGLPGSGEKIQRALIANGYPLHRVKRIVITHCDVDHQGGAAALKQATGAPILCHTVEKDWLENPGRRQPTSLLMRPLFAAVSLLPMLRAVPVTPDDLVVDGQELPEGFTVVATPGHTPGHIALLHRARRILIAGDCLSNRKGKLTLPPGIFTPDMPNAQRSAWKLYKKYGDEIDVVVFGHGPPILSGGGARIKSLVTPLFPGQV